MFLLACLFVPQSCSKEAHGHYSDNSILDVANLPNGINLSIEIQSHEDDNLLDVVFDLTVTHPSGDPQVHYKITYPDVPRSSNEAFSLNAANRKMYTVTPEEERTWEDAISTQPSPNTLQIVRLDGAAEEESWGIAP